MTHSARVVIHIGPPKTATTALQYALQVIESDNFYFGGTTQPRTQDFSELSRSLHLVSCSGVTDADCLLANLGRQLDLGRDVLISEEMFLVDSPVTHQHT